MKSKYKWDVEEIQHCVSNLSKQKENLIQYKTEVSTLKEDISAAWKSIAGSTYEESIGIDVKLLDQIIKSLDEEITKINKVVSKDYRPCEESLRNGANNLVQNIRVL